VARAGIVQNDAIAAIHTACAHRGLTLARVIPGEIALSSLTDQELEDPCALGIGAAVLDRHEPIVIRPAQKFAEHGGSPARLRLAAAVAVVSLLGSLTVPVLAARGNAAAARRELASLATSRARALTDQRDLADGASMLSAVSTFERKRISTTWMFRKIVDALPANTELASLKFDSASVTMTAVATDATDVVREMQKMAGASNVEIIGAIAYEASAGSTTGGNDSVATPERVTIRFKVPPDPKTLRAPFVGELEPQSR
jgi:hypothetical protein